MIENNQHLGEYTLISLDGLTLWQRVKLSFLFEYHSFPDFLPSAIDRSRGPLKATHNVLKTQLLCRGTFRTLKFKKTKKTDA